MEAEKMINFFTVIGALKELERFRGQFFWRDYPQRDRYESVADHTWRMAMILVTIEKYLSQPIDLSKALKMVLIHDLAEIIAGDLSPLGTDGTGKDSHLYDKDVATRKYENEKRAAEKIFGELSKEDGKVFYDLWLEYERQECFEAKVIKAIDKIEAKLQAVEYLKGHQFAKHLEFNLTYGNNTFEIDPFIKELGTLANEKFKEDYKEFIPDVK